MTIRRRGRADQQARATLAPLVTSGRAVCRRCGRPILPGQAWDAGHVEDLGLGGAPGGLVVPEHSACNRSAGGDLGNRLRRDRRHRVKTWSSFLGRPAQATPSSVHFPPQEPHDSDPEHPEPISPTA